MLKNELSINKKRKLSNTTLFILLFILITCIIGAQYQENIIKEYNSFVKENLTEEKQKIAKVSPIQHNSSAVSNPESEEFNDIQEKQEVNNSNNNHSYFSSSFVINPNIMSIFQLILGVMAFSQLVSAVTSFNSNGLAMKMAHAAILGMMSFKLPVLFQWFL